VLADLVRLLLEAEEDIPLEDAPPMDDVPEMPADDGSGGGGAPADLGGDMPDAGGDMGGGAGGILGGDGGGGGGGGEGGISGAGGGEESEIDSGGDIETLQQATQDPVKFVADDLLSKSLETGDSSKILSDAKGLIQALGLTVDQTQEIIAKLRENNPNYVLQTALTRLEQFVAPVAIEENRKMNPEDKIRHLVKEYVEIFMKKKGKLLTERASVKLSAMRVLDAEARKTAMDFEKQMVSELELVDPDDMSPEDQRRYLEAVQAMHAGIVASVVDCVNKIADLPRASEDGKDSSPSPQAIPETPQMPHQSTAPQG